MFRHKTIHISLSLISLQTADVFPEIRLLFAGYPFIRLQKSIGSISSRCLGNKPKLTAGLVWLPLLVSTNRISARRISSGIIFTHNQTTRPGVTLYAASKQHVHGKISYFVSRKQILGDTLQRCQTLQSDMPITMEIMQTNDL